MDDNVKRKKGKHCTHKYRTEKSMKVFFCVYFLFYKEEELNEGKVIEFMASCFFLFQPLALTFMIISLWASIVGRVANFV